MTSFHHTLLRALLVAACFVIVDEVSLMCSVSTADSEYRDVTGEQISCRTAFNADAELPSVSVCQGACHSVFHTPSQRRHVMPAEDASTHFGQVLSNGYRSVPVLQTGVMRRRFHTLCVLRI